MPCGTCGSSQRRSGKSTVDNMLKITNDGRKWLLIRVMNDLLPDDRKVKSIACVENAFRYWEGTADQTTQLMFCDLSTPKRGWVLSMYMTISERS